MGAEFFVIGLFGIVALYVMATEATLPKSMLSSVTTRFKSKSTSTPRSTSQAETSQSKPTADSALVVTDTTEIAGSDESKQDGGAGSDEGFAASDDSPAASMSTKPDTGDDERRKQTSYDAATSPEAKKAATDAYYGKGDGPLPESDSKDESRAEGGKSY